MRERERIKHLIGQRIRSYRNEQDRTQSDLAKAAGIDQGHLSSIETGKRNVSIDTLISISKALDVKLVDLIDTHGRLEDLQATNMQLARLIQDKLPDTELKMRVSMKVRPDSIDDIQVENFFVDAFGSS